jgi:transposase
MPPYCRYNADMETKTEITNGITTGVELRKHRGLEIAALARIDKVDGLYVVPSQYNPRQTKYKVNYGETPTCTCDDFSTRGCRCKHIYAVEFYLQRETTHHADGSTTVTENVTIRKTRKTYKQNWPAYNEAQTNEKREFQSLLAELCQQLEQPAQDMSKGGRPRLAIGDAIFSAVFKIYSTMSARRFTSDLCEAQEKGYIEKVPHFNSVLKTLEDPGLFDTLVMLIQETSIPLSAIESNFAVDSTGFAFSRFVRWYDIKYNKFTAEQQWVKLHFCTGVRTNVVTAVEIHGRDSGDSLHFPALVKKTAENFTMKEVSADKGYSGRPAFAAAKKVGATPYIMFKENTTGGVGGLFKKAFHYFSFHKEEFLAHYHQRSNVESTVMMMKAKFGDAVRSKSDVAAKNEVLCKVLCHNICCLISAIYELGLDPVFKFGDCTKTSSPAHKPGDI